MKNNADQFEKAPRVPDNSAGPITVLSLLSPASDAELRRVAADCPEINYVWAHGAAPGNRLAQLTNPNFWSLAPGTRFDAALVEPTSEEIRTLAAPHAGGGQTAWQRRWAMVGGAVVAALSPETLAAALPSAALTFDSLLLQPYDAAALLQALRQGAAHFRDRRYLTRRYARLRRLCRRVGSRRQALQQRVNLLCGDLVRSNTDLAVSVRDLRRAYAFQSQLIGEFDYHCMLYHALRQIVADVGADGAAYFACASRQFDAHLQPTKTDGFDTPAWEALLIDTVIKQVTTVNAVVIANDASAWDSPEDAPQRTPKLAVMACPTPHEGKTAGVLVLYRAGGAFADADVAAVRPLLPPLGRQAASLARLATHLAP